MKPSDLVNALKEVPETRLEIVDLAWRIKDEVGGFQNEELVGAYALEIDGATKQADNYVHQTKTMIECLRDLVL